MYSTIQMELLLLILLLQRLQIQRGLPLTKPITTYEKLPDLDRRHLNFSMLTPGSLHLSSLGQTLVRYMYNQDVAAHDACKQLIKPGVHSFNHRNNISDIMFVCSGNTSFTEPTVKKYVFDINQSHDFLPRGVRRWLPNVW
jgi:hypothetical protein